MKKHRTSLHDLLPRTFDLEETALSHAVGGGSRGCASTSDTDVSNGMGGKVQRLDDSIDCQYSSNF